MSQLRLAYTHTDSSAKYEPDPGVELIPIGPGMFYPSPGNGYPGHSLLHFNTWSVEYSLGDWQFVSERNTGNFTLQDIVFAGVNIHSKPLGYYATVPYHLAPEWNLFVHFDTYYTDREDKKGRSVNATTQVPGHNFYAFDSTLGVGYAADEHWYIAAEYHRVKGTAWLSQIENDPAETRKDWAMLVAQISHHF